MGNIAIIAVVFLASVAVAAVVPDDFPKLALIISGMIVGSAAMFAKTKFGKGQDNAE